ncbi:alanine/glycine:cation symporter family protein [Naumannella huperziae]
MDALESIIGDVGDTFWTWLVLPVVVLLGIYFTVRTGVAQIRLLPAMIKTLGNKTPPDASGKAQSISSFQAFTVSAASRVGVGNIAGVGTAIALGGPGAVFWMWLMAAIGAASAIIESTLAQVYKVKDEPFGFRGGPAYYMEKGIGSRAMGIAFAIVLVICFPFAFSSLQANTIADAVTSAAGVEGMGINLGIGLALVVMTGLVIFGGLRRIANITDKIVPVMALLYLGVGIVIVAMNIENVPGMVVAIVRDAFTPNSVTGAAVGTVILLGVKRGMFSNEAGLGSAPNAGASAAVTHPVKQGLVQSLGVYFDTMIVCSITAFIILSATPDLRGAGEGIALTQNAMINNLGPWAGVLLAVIIFLLAFSSILGNYYYGQSNIEFITGENRFALTAYRILALLAVLGGALASASLVWTIADQIMGVMALINLIALALLSGVAFKLLKSYTDQYRRGEDPIFTVQEFQPKGDVWFWQDEEQVTGYPPKGAPVRRR